MTCFLRSSAFICGLALCLLSPGVCAQAQSYPTRPIKIIVPFGPGGFTDLAARLLPKEPAPAIGQAIVRANKPGAASTIGTTEGAKPPPPRHTRARVST